MHEEEALDFSQASQRASPQAGASPSFPVGISAHFLPGANNTLGVHIRCL